MQYHIA